MFSKIKEYIFSSKIDNLSGMNINPFTLSFIDNSGKTEREFFNYYLKNYLKYLRLYILIAIIIYGAFGIFNIAVDFQNKQAVYSELIIRYIIVCPVLIVIFRLSFTKYFENFIDSSICIGIMICSLGLVLIAEISPTINDYDCSMALMLVMMFSYVFLRYRFIYTSLSCSIIVVAYCILLFYKKIEFNNFLGITSQLITANIIGIFSCYSIEKYIRSEFLMVKKYNEYIDEINNKNVALNFAISEQKRVAFELKFLNEMSQFLNKCHTEKATYDILKDTCCKLFPDDSGYVLILNNAGTKLEKIFRWNDSLSASEQIGTDLCPAFNSRENQFSPKLCSKMPSDKHGICLQINIGKEQPWGIFHLLFGQAGSDNITPANNDSKRDLAVRMIEQYALFLTNLRLRIIDPLTGLYNRIYIRDSLKKELENFEHTGIVILDIDGFKDMNENYGNDLGDSILLKLTEYLKQQIRGNDILCKYGGGEFLLSMPELTLSETGKQAEQIRFKIENEFFVSYTDEKYKITASFGVAEFSFHGSDTNELLKNVSKAVRRAKNGGGNRVVVL